MEVDGRSSPLPEDGSESDDSNPYVVDVSKYCRPETSDWIEKEGALYWQSLDETKKRELLAVSDRDLVVFSEDYIRDPWLVDFLQGATAFFQLHGTWKMFVCPDLDCSRVFKDHQSLIGHLKCDHFQDFYPIAWPSSPHTLVEEQRFAVSLRKMVWKPIVVEAALATLSTMCLYPEPVTMVDACANPDWLNSFDWVFSDDRKRKRLLLQLKEGFRFLLAKQEQTSLSLVSDGIFMTMTALASKHIFSVYAPAPTYNLSYLQCLLEHSPLSFCLLEAEHLSRFVKLVKVMCQIVRQGTSCSANRGLDSAQVDISWNSSKILEVLSASLGAVSVENGSLTDGDWESLLNSLCRVPPMPSIQKIPNKAAGIFSRVQKILEHLREGTSVASPHQFGLARIVFGPCNIPGDSVPAKTWRQSILAAPNSCYQNLIAVRGTHLNLNRELYRIRLVYEFLHLDSQLRQLCEVDCHKYILLLTGSFLRVKLYVALRRRGLPVEEGNPVAQRKSYQKENIERKFSSDGSGSECESDETYEYESDYETDAYDSYSVESADDTESGEDSDCEDDSKSETGSTHDPELDCKPWKTDPVFCRFYSTLSRSATGETEHSGPFFWMAISDIQRYCEKHPGDAEYGSVLEGIRRFRLNKTWKCWFCYSCDETFTDRESHMVHLEDKHQLCLDYEDCWLIPKNIGRDVAEESTIDVVKREPALEDSITLDQTFSYFLVDSAKLFQNPQAHEKEERGQVKRKEEFMEIIDGLRSELGDLRRIIHKKREYLTCLEVLNSLSLLYGRQPLTLLVSWFRKLSSMDWFSGTTCQLQLQFLSGLLCETVDQCYDPLCKHPVQKAFQNMRGDLLSKIDLEDKKICEALVRIDEVKRNLSAHCVYDYRMKILPSVRTFLHAKFKLDDSLISLKCNSIKDLLTSIDKIRLSPISSVRIEVESPGKVIINTKKNKSLWGFAFVGISLRIFGELLFTERIKEFTGDLKFGGWYTWGGEQHRFFGSVINYNRKASPSIESTVSDVGSYVSEVVSDMFLSLQQQYVQQISGDLEVVESGNSASKIF